MRATVWLIAAMQFGFVAVLFAIACGALTTPPAFQRDRLAQVGQEAGRVEDPQTTGAITPRPTRTPAR